jgi:hypothetical protein
MQAIKQLHGNLAFETQAVIYEVNLVIDVEVIGRFDQWLHKHTEEVLAIPGFISASMSVPDVDDENKKYRCVQFRVCDKASLEHYLEHNATEMLAEAQRIFSGRFKAERRVLSVAESLLARQGVCANCNAELIGRFCNVCGQREEPRVPTLASISSEFTHEIFGVESKLRRSFQRLLFNPGHLTSVYLSGKRQKYMSPVRLYLLFSIVTFACFTLLNNFGGLDFGFENDSDNAPIVNIDPKMTIDTDIGTEPRLEGTESHIERAEPTKPLPGGGAVGGEAEVFVDPIDGLGLFSNEVNDQIAQRVKTALTSIKEDVEAGNKDAVFSKFLEPLPTALFIFLPIVALLFKILYLGSGRYYVEHLIYILHNHAFLFAVIIFTTLISQVTERWVQTDIYIAIAWPSLLVICIYPRLRKFLIKKYSVSKKKGFLYLSFMLIAMAILFNWTLGEGASILVDFLWAIYVPFYIYRSMIVVYERSRWVTIASFALISAMYLVLLTFMLLASAVFVGYTY